MNKIFVLVISTIIVCFGLSSCEKTEATSSNKLEIAIDSLISQTQHNSFNGMVLIAKDEESVFLKMYGFSDLELKTPFKPEDQFVVGSISKQFTATIILQEYEKGNIDLHTSIRSYLPDLSMSWADTVTVHHLLAHTHGIVSLDEPTKFSVGTQYDYSQIGYDLLAKISERVSGKSFAELSSELFKRCNMINTFHPDQKEYRSLVRGYEENKDGGLKFSAESLRQYPAAGAFISSAFDLLLWNQYLFGGKLLKVETFVLMTSKKEGAVRNHPIFGHTEYGYGITIADDNIIQWGQTGYAPGFVSMNFYFPKTKMSVIVLENICYNTYNLKETFFYHKAILDIVKAQQE